MLVLARLLSENLGLGFPKADNQLWWKPEAGTAKTKTPSLCVWRPTFCTKNQAELALLFMFYGAW